MELVECYYVPSDKDPDSFGAIMYAVFYNNCPKLTGYMASCTEYEVDDEFVWFYNDCVYAHYQDTATSNAGFWEDGLTHAYNVACRDALPRDVESPLGNYIDEYV